jgi:hypothetical protein
MAKYMLLLGGADLDKRSGNPALVAVMMDRYMGWLRSLEESGKLKSRYKLHDQTGARLTVRGGEVVEGPFIETKEAVGGLFVIEAASLEEATAIGRRCPVLDLQKGYVEVRVVEEPRIVARPGS